MRIGNRDFDFADHTYIMGILNVTPDSFSDGGSYETTDDAIRRVFAMEKEGMEILDIGGESTRPGASFVSEEEELGRVLPVIEALRKVSDLPISVDTRRARVAKAALDAGADLINDVSGLEDPDMAPLIAERGVPYVLMDPSFQGDGPEEGSGKRVVASMLALAEKAESAGIRREQLILDPGIGFHGSGKVDLDIVRELPAFCNAGYPVLVGGSRKSFLGKLYTERLKSETEAKQRVGGTVALTFAATLAGAGIIRVHDIWDNVQAVALAEGMMRRPV
jgi:dihydropteroate synthase